MAEQNRAERITCAQIARQAAGTTGPILTPDERAAAFRRRKVRRRIVVAIVLLAALCLGVFAGVLASRLRDANWRLPENAPPVAGERAAPTALG